MQRNVMTRRYGSVLLAIVIVVGLLLSALPAISLTVFAQTIEVNSAAGLKSALESAQNNDTIILTQDIDMYGTTWTPADVKNGVTFNGNHKVIFNTNNTLFDCIYGTVFNVGVVLNGNKMTAVPAVLANNIRGNMFNCFAYGSLQIQGDQPVGGMISRCNGSIEACFSLVNIDSGAPYVGGFVGLIESGSVKNCYSSGTVLNTNHDGYTAGFANIADAVSPTLHSNYTTCQLRTVNSKASPSGINMLYDNQLSLVRENTTNHGLSTKELMNTTSLNSEHFVVTSTAYPSLKIFSYSGWSDRAKNVARLSVAAAAFSDVDATKRMEPSDNFVGRADYLTRDVYVDRTNALDMKWTIDSDVCKLYDTVPQTTIIGEGSYITGTGADLLRARMTFTSDDSSLKMIAQDGGYTRTWYLSSYDSNPYFVSGNGKTNDPFVISSKQQLDHMRYYTRIDTAEYKLNNDIAVGAWDPIEDFRGTLVGNNKTLSGIQLNTAYSDTIGFFANVQSSSKIQDIVLKNVTLSSDDSSNTYVGALVGQAVGNNSATVTLDNIAVYGSETALHGNGTVGAVIGQAVHTSVNNVLVSADVKGETAVGGIVGELHSGTLSYCGVTGAVTGYNFVGGLVGKIPASSTITDCYVTAAVVTDANASNTPVRVGGLIGDNAAGTIGKCYVAGAVHATQGVSCGAFVGNGSTKAADASCVYDSNIVWVTGVGGLKTDAMHGSSNMTAFANGWAKSNGYYPQIAYFSNHTNTELKQLSAISTVPLIYQNYWQDGTALNMTTGWLSKTILDGNANTFIKPTVFERMTVYEVNSGWGFEANSGSQSATVSFVDNSKIGLRKAVAVRPDLMSLSYTVNGANGVNAYVEVYYSTDKTSWNGFQVMSVSDNAQTVKHLYDIPEGSYIRVRVRTVDDYTVDTITIAGTALTYNTQTGYYESAVVYNTDVLVNITLKKANPEWGFRRESY